MSSDLKIRVSVDSKSGEARVELLGSKFQKLGMRGEKAFKGIKSEARRMQTSLSKTTGMVTGLGAAFGLWQTGRIATQFLDVAESFEMMEVKLDALTKGHGPETLEKINAWALDMPVNTRKAVDTFAMMQAMGLNPTIEKMQTLVDVSSIFSQEAMPRVARALGQMQTLGKLSAEELNQMSEAGINARKYLTEAFDMTVEEIKGSQIAIEDIIDAIWKGLDADFGGSAQKAMDSWAGLKATFISYTEEIERKVMNAGIFEELKTQLGSVNVELSDWIDNNDDLLKQKVPEYIDRVKTSVSGVVDIYDTIDGNLVEVGVLGGILFGKFGPVKLAAAVYLINEQLDTIGMGWKGYTTHVDKAGKSMAAALAVMKDIFAGKRDMWTGEYLPGQEGGTYGVYTGKIPQPPEPEYNGPTNRSPSYPVARTTPTIRPFSGPSTRPSQSAWSDLTAFETLDTEFTIKEIEKRQKLREQEKEVLAEMDAQFSAAKLEALLYQLDQEEAAVTESKDKLVSIFKLTADEMDAAFTNAFGSITDGLVELAMTGSTSFTNMVNSMVADLARLIIQANITQPLATATSGFFTSMFTPSAQGNVFSSGSLVAFARGGVVNRPTIFPMARGAGLMGEEGPEAVMPLARTGSGDLGVKVSGSTTQAPPVHFHIHAIDTQSGGQFILQNKNLFMGMVQQAWNKTGRRGPLN